MATTTQPSSGSQTPAPESEVVGERLARLAAEVAAGIRDARSLVLISREMAVSAGLSFPKDPYGHPQDRQESSSDCVRAL